MDSNEFNWKIVSNTVTKRMVDSSFVHKLAPSKRLCRRTKVMNTAIKHLHRFKNYKEFIDMKTAILRNLSDDDDTDDNNDLSDTEYSVLYKSDVDLTTSAIDITTTSIHYSESEYDVSNYDISDMKNQSPNAERSKNKSSSDSVNLGLQKVVKRNVQSTCSPEKNIQESEPNELNETNNYEPSASSSKKIVCKKNIRKSEQNEPSVSSSDKVVCKKNIQESEPNEPSASSSDKAVCKKNIRESEPNELNGTNNYEPSASTSNKAVCEKVLETCSRKMCYNKKTNGIKAKQGTNEDYTRSSEGVSNSSNDEGNEKLNKSNCSRTLKSNEKLNGIRKDLISFLDEETMVQHVDKHSVNAEVCVRESCSRLKVEYLKVQEVSTDERESSESSLMQSPFNGKTNHPKDSGIDEDTEEEFHDIGRIVYAKKKKKMPEVCKNAKLTLPVLNCKDASTIGTTLSNADDLLSDIHDTSDTTDSQYTAPVTNKGTNSETKEENKLQKVKLQPKVTCSTVIKNKYRIISDNALLLDKCSESSISDDYISNKTMDPANIKHNPEDSMSPLSKRRLQQMRRLNLTGDSESSPSDDDNEYCNTENMRDKLFNRSKELSDLSGSEDENMGFKHSLSLQNNKKLTAHRNSRFGKNRKKKNIHSRESYTDNNESVQSSNTSSNNYKDTSSETETYLLADQYKTNTWNSFEQSVRCSSNESDSAKENTEHESLSQKTHHTEKISKIDEIATRTMTKNSALRTRPHNLQELMDEESLVYETTLPSITLKDLQENNIFVLDIPSMVVETKLLGRKFILTENKLKLGKHKYKVALNDIDHMSCVLSTGEFCKDYRAVNIKPMKKLIAYEKIVKAASEK
ncbi:uncharacterized protein LOC143216103 [Lasioglossum baleicum]|uniref:uncharacterized protein LOC143216103 n=1 Tax=Lasioglossum baleicum TaxID=434251 RepID=UPI003FCE3BA3